VVQNQPTVFVDNNNNGQQDADDIGIRGVKVMLMDSNGDLIGITITNAAGDYFFDALKPGDYFVQIPVQNNFNTGDPLALFRTSSDPTDTNDNQEDADDNGIQTGGSGTLVTSPLINLMAGQEPTNESGQGGNQDA